MAFSNGIDQLALDRPSTVRLVMHTRDASHYDLTLPSTLHVCGIAVLTAGSRAHYDYAVWPGRRSAQAAPSALTRPKGA